MAIWASFLAGILAAFTPCILVLFPALVYRFTETKKEDLARELTGFTISFIGTFFVVAMFLSKILSSMVKEGFQLGIGLLFVVLAILALTKRLNPLQFPLIKNSLLFGFLFAIIASVNPCAFAYLGIVASTQTTTLVLSFIAFAVGLLIPSILFALFGKALFARIHKTQKLMKRLNDLLNILLGITGLYLMLKISHIGKADVLMATILLGVTFLVLLRAFYFFQGKLTFSRMLLILALLILLIATVWHCNDSVSRNEITNNVTPTFTSPNADSSLQAQPTCSDAGVAHCAVCRRCTILFGIATLLGFGAILLSNTMYIHSLQQARKKKKK